MGEEVDAGSDWEKLDCASGIQPDDIFDLLFDIGLHYLRSGFCFNVNQEFGDVSVGQDYLGRLLW
jgi:hypothetical protein